MIVDSTILSVVIPVFNEEESIAETILRVEKLQFNIPGNVEFIYVNDGSTDSSMEILRKSSELSNNMKVLSFSRNFGHQIAITAGIDLAVGDYVAVIDADLQDPPELIVDMYQLALKGFDVVYGKRSKRAGETIFKKVSALIFYKVMNYMCELEIPENTGDFRLMSRKVVEAFKGLRERHRFVRGMVPWLGYKSIALEYDRHERFAGETKYPLSKMVKFAVNAILSFSSKPLSIAIKLGLCLIFLGLIGCLYMLWLKFFTDIPVPGLTAILLSIVLFGGTQIFLTGIVGEYIAMIFEEIKGRPLYIIDEKINI